MFLLPVVLADSTPATKMGVEGASFKLVMKHRRTIGSQAKHGNCQLSSLYIIIGGNSRQISAFFPFFSPIEKKEKKKIGAATVGDCLFIILLNRSCLYGISEMSCKIIN